MGDCRLIIDPPAPGAWNMAVDEALLADAIENGVATLRLYQWSEPTLSLGYFQRYEDRNQHAASCDADVVRRQSGGGAILHDHELTYSLVLPATHPLAGHADEIYTTVHQIFIEILAPRLAESAARWVLRLRGDECKKATSDEPFLCFQRRAKGDLILVPAGSARSGKTGSSGHKILGSAQRRRQGAILQHGSLLLEKSPAAPELEGLNDLTAAGQKPADLAAELLGKLSVALSLHPEMTSISADRQSQAADLESRKYAAPAWTKRR